MCWYRKCSLIQISAQLAITKAEKEAKEHDSLIDRHCQICAILMYKFLSRDFGMPF